MFLRKSTNISLALLLFAGALLGHTSCMPHNMASISQDVPTPKKPGKVETIPKAEKISIEEALPDSLIALVKDEKLQEYLRKIRQNPATIDADVESDRTVLQLAAINDERAVLKGLLKAGADPNIVLDQRYHQHTALLDTVVFHKDIKAIQALLNTGADALHQNGMGSTALHIVATWENVDNSTHKKVIEALLVKDPDILINLKDAQGKTPLDIAIMHQQNDEIISFFREKKKLYDEQTGDKNFIEQALSGALIGQVRDSALRERLRKLRKDPTQINQKNQAGKTPLQDAMECIDPTALQALLKAGADPNIKYYNTDTVLHYAVREGDLLSINALIAAKAELNCQGILRDTPLHIAVKKGLPEMVKILAAQPGINFHKKNIQGLTPLRVAKKQVIIDILTKYGATH